MRKPLLLLCLLLGHAAAAQAGTLTFYTDRAAWLADAATAGLTVTVEDFASDPGSLAALDVGGVEIAITSTRAVWDAGNERIGYLSGGGRLLTFDVVSSLSPLFGFGLDLGPTIGNIGTTDVDGVSLAEGAGGGDPHFLGVLGTAALDPANPFPSNPALSFDDEFLTSGLALSVHLDDLSVATGVPEPGRLGLLAFASAALAASRRSLRR